MEGGIETQPIISAMLEEIHNPLEDFSSALMIEEDDADERSMGEAYLDMIDDDAVESMEEDVFGLEGDYPPPGSDMDWDDLSDEDIAPTDDIPPEFDDGSIGDNLPGDDPDSGYPAPDTYTGSGSGGGGYSYPPPAEPISTPMPEPTGEPTQTAISQAAGETPTPPAPTPTAPEATRAAAAAPTAEVATPTAEQATPTAEEITPPVEEATPTAPLPAPTESGETPTLEPELPTATSLPEEPSPTPQVTSTLVVVVDVLTAVRVESAPALDGQANDSAWAGAAESAATTTGGANASDTRVTLKAVYDDERVYFLLTWADPTRSFLLNPWEKQPGGEWAKRIGEGSSGGDENVFAEDKLALYWPASSVPDFAERGCFTACHSGEAKPYGSKYTAAAGQIIDAWVWKSVRGVAQVDDLYVDSTPYSADQPNAGRKSDASTGGGYSANSSEDGKLPAFMLPGGGDKTGAPGFIADGEKAAFDDALFQPGERLPSVVTAPFQGDRGDIHASWTYANGTWTLEISRKRLTGSAHDVQFSELNVPYFFGLATFDNTQVRHAYHSGSLALVLKP